MITLGFSESQSSRPADADQALRAKDEPQVDRGSLADEANAVLMALLPWGISVLFHVGLVLVAVFAIWTTVNQIDDQEVIVPMIRLSTTPGAPLQMRTEQRMSKRTPTSRRIIKPTRNSSQQATLSATVNTETSLIGVAGVSSKATPFNSSVANAAEFKTSFMGTGGNARRIVFLIDASGSLIDTLPFVIEELKKSIQQLNEKQMISVIFFRGDQVIEVPPAGFKPATLETKQRIVSWIDPRNHNIIPQGKSNPVPALERAMKYRPQLIFLLSDNITGEGAYAVDQRKLLTAINQANTTGTKINTIQFLYPDPLARLGLPGTMELIAKNSGGVYKFLNQDELKIKIR